MSVRSLKALLCGMLLFTATGAIAQTRNEGAKQPDAQRFFFIPGSDTFRVLKVYPANNAAARAECASWMAKLVKVNANQYECRKGVEYQRPKGK